MLMLIMTNDQAPNIDNDHDQAPNSKQIQNPKHEIQNIDLLFPMMLFEFCISVI